MQPSHAPYPSLFPVIPDSHLTLLEVVHLISSFQLSPCRMLLLIVRICGKYPKRQNRQTSVPYPGTLIYEVTDTTDPDFPEKHMAVSFRYRLLDEFLQEWQLRKKQLASGEITKEEYQEWKLNWPQTADDCGKHEPHKKWRKE